MLSGRGGRNRETPFVPTGSSGHGAQERSRDETARGARFGARPLMASSTVAHTFHYKRPTQRCGEFSTGTSRESPTGIDTRHSAVGRDRDPACDGAGDRPPDRAGFHFAHREAEALRRSTDVGAYLGFVPRVHQSGKIDRMGRITKAGDNLTCSYLVESANVLLTRIERPCPLREWGLGIIQRAGLKKAQVAVARKLATMLHAMWTDGTEFEEVGNGLTSASPGSPNGGLIAGTRAGADRAAIVAGRFRTCAAVTSGQPQPRMIMLRR